METLFAKQDRLLMLTSTEIVRTLMHRINWNAQLIAIRGPRGVGKTTLMLQYVKQHYEAYNREALYCTLDSVYFSNHTLLELVDTFYKHGGKHLFLDEVHKYPTWSKEIKEIYDMYPDLRVVFSASSLLNILNADADLSRRCIPYEMQGLSFREFMLFYKQLDLPICTLEEVLNSPGDICSRVNEVCRPLAFFKEYLQYGYYPFYLKNQMDYYTSIEQVTNFIIESELPQLCGVDIGNVRKLKALLGILATSVPFEVDISKLSTTIGIHRNTVIEYLNSLERAKLLRLLYADLLSVKKMQKPDKIYLDNPNLLYALASHPVKIGTARETFVVNQLGYMHEVEYGKKTGDFKVNGCYTLEVGGEGKGYNQIADLPDSYILADDIETPYRHKLPIWIVGFLY
ncbi:ATP-binding protein [Bacteroides cellulosilyticus]|uniref:ATP-binding protein n=1 Tax=Bacteroides cellulosilyticus TaxID=246787 RepID=UPI0018AC4F14|nr:AAA family ATPase [Bacteroides cellulosilyticus]